MAGLSRRGKPYVPVHVVAELVAPVVAEYGVVEACTRLDVHQRALYGWLHGVPAEVSWRVVDELLCRGLGRPELWHLDPRLAEVYRQVA